jgi:hypothetical protein
MVDGGGKVDTLIVPGAAAAEDIMKIWSRVIDLPIDLRMTVSSHNDREFYWGIEEDRTKMISCTLRSGSSVGNATIFAGSDTFKVDQLCRLFEVKVPPFEQCRITVKPNGETLIEQEEDWVPLSRRVLRERALVWNLNWVILSAPQASTGWLPYDFGVVMR